MASATVVAGRPSMDSITTRTDSGGVNGRMAQGCCWGIGIHGRCSVSSASFIPLNSEEFPKQTWESPGSRR